MSFEIIMDGSRILWTTSFSWEDNSDVDETTTHSGVITTPDDVGNHKIKIDNASINDYVEENEVYGFSIELNAEDIIKEFVKP